MRNAILHLVQGFCIGAADVVPGVSGGTMAFILRIYYRLLEAIRSFDTVLVRLLFARRFRAALEHVDCALLVPLAVGILTAVVFFTRVVSLPRLITTHPTLIYGLFFGLIVASLVVLFRSLERIRLVEWMMLLAGIIAGFGVVNLVPVSTPEAPWFIALSGALAISAMLLPGISGSFILLILHKYAYVLDGIGRFDLGIIIPFGVGIVFGLLVTGRMLTYLLHTWYRPTLFAICGLLIGALWIVWPFQERYFEVVRGKSRLLSSSPIWPEAVDGVALGAFALMAVGFVLVVALDRFASKRGGSPLA